MPMQLQTMYTKSFDSARTRVASSGSAQDDTRDTFKQLRLLVM